MEGAYHRGSSCPPRSRFQSPPSPASRSPERQGTGQSHRQSSARCSFLRETKLTRAGPERGAGNHRSIESGRLALPDVLPARTRHRLGGMFLCHRLPADGTILTPHTGPAFSSTNRLRASGNVKLIDHGVEFFQLLHGSEKLERFSISGYRPG